MLRPLAIASLALLAVSQSVRRQLRQPDSADPVQPPESAAPDAFLEPAGLRQQTLDRLACYLRHYSLGSCGPRGFLGTFAAHVQLEMALERLHGLPCVLYSCSSTAVQSALGACGCDTVLLQPGSSPNLARCAETQRAVGLDLSGLGALAPEAFAAEMAALRCKLAGARPFLAVDSHRFEAGFPVPADLLLAKRVGAALGVRVLLNNLMAPLQPELGNFDLVAGCFHAAYGVSCGFVCGSRLLVENQRYGGLGYCFSASAPPALVQVLLDLVRDRARLEANCAELRARGLEVEGFYARNAGRVLRVRQEWGGPELDRACE
ncbi:Serine palmitoyltransferase 1 [Spironucleus salmonicida]|uniref:Serine palmitoyltransferase 1 n=1 Tax=Spironucleus salmonicida TaxID=348837 RepID=A0A9P8RWZ7_9EUKA|nr:Serine palmitoyltransferase 1 [Spironucleus salmonicida]